MDDDLDLGICFKCFNTDKMPQLLDWEIPLLCIAVDKPLVPIWDNLWHQFHLGLHSVGALCSPECKGAIKSKIKHAIKPKTSPARFAQLSQPSLAFCFSLQPMTTHRPLRRHWLHAETKCQWGLQQLCKSCRTCFKFYCIFCNRSLTQPTDQQQRRRRQSWWVETTISFRSLATIYCSDNAPVTSK